MTPTTNEREAFEAWVRQRHGLSTEKWADSGKYKYDDTNRWWECWQAALTREQREGVCPKCNGAGGERWHEADGSENGARCDACDGFGTPQQEAPGAVWMASVCEAAAEAMESNGLANRTTRLREVAATLRTTPPAPVDVDVRVAELIAADREYDEAASYAAYVKDPVGNGARKAAATKRRARALALLDGQQAGVVIDEGMVERLAKHIVQQESRNCSTLDESLHHQSKWKRAIPEARAALQAALGDGGGRG